MSLKDVTADEAHNTVQVLVNGKLIKNVFSPSIRNVFIPAPPPLTPRPPGAGKPVKFHHYEAVSHERGYRWEQNIFPYDSTIANIKRKLTTMPVLSRRASP